MIILSNKSINEGDGQGTSPPVGSEPELHHLLINMSAAPGPSTIPTEPPPSFSPYVAEFSLTGTGDVISHDPHLNTDGEALYRFLLSQSRVLPSLRIGFRGKHTEIKQRWVRSTDSQGRHTDRTESYTESVTDFDFCIEVCPEHLLALGTAVIPANDEESGYTPAHWSIADNEPVYRGKMVREYEIPLDLQEGSPTTMPGIPAGRRKATRKEIKRYKRWLEKKQQLGYPPWMQESEDNLYVDGIMLSIEENPTLRSSKTLRDWADEYCASPKYLKEFQYEKVLYGWNLAQLEKSLRSLILAAPYNGETSISFTTHSSKIYIRPSNRVSRMLSNKWLKFLSIILLIFPFIWLFKRFHKKGGGTWEVCGGAYPLKQWVPLREGETVPSKPLNQPGLQEEVPPPYHLDPNPWSTLAGTSQGSPSFSPSARYIQTASGMRKLVGIREGEWFRIWEGAITRAILGRYQSTEPMRNGAPLSPSGLDVYNEATGLLVEV